MRNRTENLNFFEDMAKIAGGAIKSMSDAKGQIKSMVSGFLEDMDLVTREEFEHVEAIAKKALERQAEFETRVKALEKTPAKTASPAKKAAKKTAKTAVKKTTSTTRKKKK